MFPFPLVVLVAVLSASLAQAATFVGCVLAAEVALTGSGGAFVTSQTACNTRCTSRGAQYSYYTAGSIPTTNNCYCDNVGSYVAASAYAVGSGGTTCLATVQAVATNLATTFTFNGCVGTIVGVTVNLQQGTILGGSIVTGPQQCFQTCSGNLRAYVIPIVPSVTAVLPSYGCVCDPSGQVTTGICGIGQFYGFQHPASASGQARKRQHQLILDDQRRRAAFCPKGMKACNIQGVDNSWECIDTATELESCGGCTFGEYTSRRSMNTTSTGTDCSTLPGTVLGGTTCTDGRCEISACKKRWKLVDGRCVPGAIRTARKITVSV